MLKFVELHYINAVAFYQKIDGYGSRASAGAACFFYSLGIASIALNIVQHFTGSLAPLVRSVLPHFDRPHDNAAEYVLAVPFALILHYFWLWKRAPMLLERYPWVTSHHPRWLLVVGALLSILFLITTGLGRYSLLLSSSLAVALLVSQEGIRVLVERRQRARPGA